MMLYQGELWKINRYMTDQIFQGMFLGGINHHLAKIMGVWLISKFELITIKNKKTAGTEVRRHLQYAIVWEDNPAQTYELVEPD